MAVAHLVDHVFPKAPVRQWVLSRPYPLRLPCAFDHELMASVRSIFIRAGFSCTARRARALDLTPGHPVLQAGGELNFEAASLPPGAGDFYVNALPGFRQRPISALGDQGGAGQGNDGGANEDGPTSWRCDAIPSDAFVPGVVTPPLDIACFHALDGAGAGPDLFDWDDPKNVAVAGGDGDGSPGVIQLHVASTDNIVVPAEASGDLTKLFVPPPVGWSQWVFRGRFEPNLCSLLPATWNGGGQQPLGFDVSLKPAAEGPFHLGQVLKAVLSVDFHAK